jgi:hypothetical protein
VEFAGTASHPSSSRLLLGYLERRVADGAWCFYLRLWGVPESTVGEYRDELARAALGAIGRAVAECLSLPAAEVVKPSQLLLCFAVGPDGVVPECRVKLVNAYSFSAARWWESPRLT